MNYKAFLTGANIVTVNKDKKYGMTCAWAMQTDYDKIVILIGEQSLTGKQIVIGDFIGVSALSENQEEIARVFGNYHSNEIDKFDNSFWFIKNNVILIKEAKNQMIIKVDKIIKLEDNLDLLIYGYIVDFIGNDKKFINYDKI